MDRVKIYFCLKEVDLSRIFQEKAQEKNLCLGNALEFHIGLSWESCKIVKECSELFLNFDLKMLWSPCR